MLDDIKQRHDRGLLFDFVLVTGDLAFSGQESEYGLVKEFFYRLSSAIGLSCNRFFCVPGNHDVDRDRQTTCFAGARHKLQSQAAIYSFLGNAEERQTLLLRLSNFCRFQESFFSEQRKERTDDDLGYVSVFDVDDIRIAIIGLNSAWLAEGGQSDEHQLLLGEEQVRNAVDIVNSANPHVVIGMGHHPFDLLRDFDRRSTQRRLEEACHYFHCGHLHVPDASMVVLPSGRCLTLSAGASFESREARNSYTTITLDLLNATADVTFVQFDPTKGVFSNESKYTHRHELDIAVSCTISDLGHAIESYCPMEAADFSYYLAALLLGAMSEVPIHVDNSVVFLTFDLLKNQPEDELTAVTKNFLTVGNAIKLLHPGGPLNEILATNGRPIAEYSAKLRAICVTNDEFRAQIAVRETYARQLAGLATDGAFEHTLALLNELRAVDDWDGLREYAERSCTLNALVVPAIVKRLLALCLARSTARADRERAAGIYRALTLSAEGEANDWANLATLQTDDGDNAQAKETVLNAIEVFPQQVNGFVEIGLKIVESTGDLDFRAQLLACKQNRRET